MSRLFFAGGLLLRLVRDVALEIRGPDSARSILRPDLAFPGRPGEAELLAGRLLNPEADIGLDFPHDICEELISRVIECRGRNPQP